MRLKTEQQLGRMGGGSVVEVLIFSLRITGELYGYDNNNSKDVEIQLKTNLKEGRQESQLRLPARLSSVAHGHKAWQDISLQLD